MYHEYPYTTYWHDIEKMCKMCKSLGYRLELNGDYLRLVDAKNNVISSVKIHFAEVAAEDVNGNQITSYIIDAGVSGTGIVLTHGDNSVTTLTIPYSETAGKDTQNKDILNYVYGVSVNGDNLTITKGDSTFANITIPFATKAQTDINNKAITTYAASLETDGLDLVLRDSLGRELSRINTIDDNYGVALEAGVTTVRLKAGNGDTLSEITVPYATKALSDDLGNTIKSSYGSSIEAGTNTIKLKAKDGSQISEITVPFATNAIHASAAIESVGISGNMMTFTTSGGQSYSVTAPYAVKATQDNAGNIINSTYVASVQNDTQTGELIFKAANGTTIATLVPTVNKASYDSLNNFIANYINSVVADPQSDYVLITHGDGTVDSIKIRYSDVAWKDTNGNVIKNTYVTDITIEPNPNDITEMDLVGWNGDNPIAEVFRHPLDGLFGSLAFKDYVEATYTPDGTVSSTFVGDSTSISGTVTPTGTVSGTAVSLGTKSISEITSVGTLPSKAADTYVAPSATYDATTETLTFNPGSFSEGAFSAGTLPTTSSTTVADGSATVTDPTFTGNAASISGTVTPTGTVNSSFIGTTSTIRSE